MKHRLYDSNVPKQMIVLELNSNFIAFSDDFGDYSVIKDYYHPCMCCGISQKQTSNQKLPTTSLSEKIKYFLENINDNLRKQISFVVNNLSLLYSSQSYKCPWDKEMNIIRSMIPKIVQYFLVLCGLETS